MSAIVDAASPWNYSFITKDEYNQSINNPIVIVQKAENILKLQRQNYESLKAKSSVDLTNAEQLFQQLEKDYIGCKKDLDELNQQNLRSKLEIQALNKKNQDLLAESNKFKELVIEKESRSNTLGKLYDELQQEKSSLHSIIERKDKDLKEETEAVTKLTERLNEFIKEKSEMKNKIITLENDNSSYEFQINRLKQEINELRKQNDYIEENYKKQIQNYFNDSKELKSFNLDLKSKNELLTEDVTRLNTMIGELKNQIKENEKLIEKQSTDIKVLGDEKIQSTGQFEHELEIQKRLVTLYKDNSEESAKKVSNLQSTVDSLREINQKLVKEHEDAYKKMEEAYDQLQEDYQKIIREYDEFKSTTGGNSGGMGSSGNGSGYDSAQTIEIPILSDNVKNRIVEVTNLGTREEIRRELLDMVQRYDELTKITLNEKREKRFVQDHLNHVLYEVEKKAPLIHEQNREYQRLLKSQEKLLNSYQEIQSQKDTLQLKITTITNENSKLIQESNDLQKQVRNLLREALDGKGGSSGGFSGTGSFNGTSSIRSSMRQSTSLSSPTSEFDQIIPDSLVTFNNIEELQVKNQELLRTVRSLTQEIQAHTENDKKLEIALKELEFLKNSRERQTDMIDSLVKQRDHFKSMMVVQGGNSTIGSPPASSTTSTNSGGGSISLADLSNSVGPQSSPSSIFNQSRNNNLDNSQQQQQQQSQNQQQLDKEYQLLKQNYANLQKEYESAIKDRTVNDKEMLSKIETLKDQVTNFKINLSQSENEKIMLKERLKLLSDSVKNQSTDLDNYRQKNQECMQIIINHQKQLETLGSNLARVEELKNQAEIRLHNLKSENEIFKSSEARLLEMNKSLSLEKLHMESLLDKVNTLNMSKESAESELRRRIENDLNEQEKVRIQLKKELEDEKQNHKQDQQTLGHQINELRERLEKKEKDLTELKETTLKHKIAEQTLQQKVVNLESQLVNAENRFNSLLERTSNLPAPTTPTGTSSASTTTSSTTSATQSLDLSLAKSEIESLKEALSQEKENGIHYKSIALSLETDLSKAQQEITKIRLEMEEKLKEAESNLQASYQQMKEQSIKLEKLENFSSSYQKDVNNIASERDALAKEKQELLLRNEQLTKDQQAAIEEAKLQAEQCKKATENYERELVLHAEDIKGLPLLRAELQESKNRIIAMASKMEGGIQTFETAKHSWSEQESQLRSQISELEERIKDLKHHNSLLNAQIEKITIQSSHIDKVNALITSVSSANGGENQSTTDERDVMINNLRELTQLQTREQKILEVKVESLQQENIRLKQTTQHNQRLIDTLTAKLAEEQEHLKNLTFSSKKHEEVLQQLDQMNLFKESNVMLKDEVKKLNALSAQLRDKLKQTEDLMIPLREANSKLESENSILKSEIEAQKTEIGIWSSKVQKLLDKYQSIDPEVHQKLIESNEATQKENQSLQQSIEEKGRQYEELKKHAKHWKDESKKHSTQVNILKETSNTMKQQVDTLTSEKETTEKLVQELKKKVQTLSAVKKNLTEEATLKSEIENLKKSGEENEKKLKEEVNLLKHKLRVFEALKKNAATAISPTTAPTATTPTTTTTTSPTNISSAPVAASPLSPVSTPLPTAIPVAPAVPPTTTTTPPPKRIFKKPAPSTLQSLLQQQQKPPAKVAATVPPATTTIVTPSPATTTTTITPVPTSIFPNTTPATTTTTATVSSPFSPFSAKPATTTTTSIFGTTSTPVVPPTQTLSQPIQTTPTTTTSASTSPPPTISSVPTDENVPASTPTDESMIEDDTTSSSQVPPEEGEEEMEEGSIPTHGLKKQKLDIDQSTFTSLANEEQEQQEEEEQQQQEEQQEEEENNGANTEEMQQDEEGAITTDDLPQENPDTETEDLENNNNNNNNNNNISTDSIQQTDSSTQVIPTTPISTISTPPTSSGEPSNKRKLRKTPANVPIPLNIVPPSHISKLAPQQPPTSKLRPGFRKPPPSTLESSTTTTTTQPTTESDSKKDAFTYIATITPKPEHDTSVVNHTTQKDFQKEAFDQLIGAIKHNSTSLCNQILSDSPNKLELLNKKLVNSTSSKTPLYIAVEENCYPDLILLLIQNGADPNQTVEYKLSNTESSSSSSAATTLDQLSSSPIAIPFSNTNSTTITDVDLISAYYNKPAPTEAPIHIAARKGSSDVLNLLITNKADKNILDSLHRTPLMISASNGRMECTRLLVLNGANVKIEDNLKKTALHLAIDGEFEDIASTILGNGGDVTTRYHYRPTRQSTLTPIIVNGSLDSKEVEILGRLDRYGHIKDQTGNQQLDKTLAAKKKKEIEKELSRAQKWFVMMRRWEPTKKRPSKIRSRAIKGIPDRVRGQAWAMLSQGCVQLKDNPDTFTTLLEQHSEWETPIDLDVNRASRNHIYFKDRYGIGQVSLFNVLKVYSLYDKDVGYTQGMSSIASLLVMYMPEKEAFWTLERLMNKEEYGMRGMFSNGLVDLHKMIFTFDKLFKIYLPELSKQFVELRLDSVNFAIKWFILGFLDTFPFHIILRVWDLIFSEGFKIVYSISITLLKMLEKQLLGKTFEQCFEVFNSIEHMESINADQFIKSILKNRINPKRIQQIEEQYVHPQSGNNNNNNNTTPAKTIEPIKKEKRRFSFFGKN
eukprot:gene2324-2868_t